MSKNKKISKLAGFIKSLESINFKFNVNRFDNRLKLQKFVYLAKRYGIDLDYNYNLYIHGPYSPELADDYYHMEDDSPAESIELPEDFLRLIKGKSERWLEFAATLVMIKERYPELDEKSMINLVRDNKPFAEEKELWDILIKLKKYNAI